MVVDYKGQKVKLFFIRYNNAKKWSLILTTDLSISFIKAIEIYQICWTIEVLFKECRQYLQLGGSQNTDFDGQIADITITLITHTILSLQKRFTSYETMHELFRETQLRLLELTLWERLLKNIYEISVINGNYFDSGDKRNNGEINAKRPDKSLIISITQSNRSF